MLNCADTNDEERRISSDESSDRLTNMANRRRTLKEESFFTVESLNGKSIKDLRHVKIRNCLPKSEMEPQY